MVDSVYMAAAAPLDSRLADVALTLLEEEGAQGLTLREVARRAGVSHGAPLRHFQGLAGLLSEVASRGFEQLAEAVEQAAGSAPPGAGSLERLRAAARAYVHTAAAHPHLFALMFRRDSADWEDPRLLATSAAAFEQLVQLLRAAQDAGFHPSRDTRMLAGVVWSCVHGLATLWSQDALSEVVRGATLEDALDTLLAIVTPETPLTAPGGHS
jgi:AcrR family transcriptional regulator